jgi:hypothetical protein
MKKTLTTLTLFFLCTCCYAQEILPTELFQVFKFWTMDIANFDKNTYDYIQTVDKQWELRVDPEPTENGINLYMGYQVNKAWYKDNECKIMLTYNKSMKNPKAVLYQFTEAENWNRYNRQMQVMEAVGLMNKTVQGGTMRVYEAGNILIYLTEFLPGINGVERSYQVIFSNNN